MSFKVKELYYTLQGEGARAGRAAVFCRFSGCNLWTGRAADRASAVCNFCDTDFLGTDGPGGGRFETAGTLAYAIEKCWRSRAQPGHENGSTLEGAAAETLPLQPEQSGVISPAAPCRCFPGARPYVVFTGGEPLLQLTPELISLLHATGFEVAVETNGTIAAPAGLDWICVSPKAGAPLVQRSGHELKLVFPQEGLDPAALEALAFENFFLQPMDGPAARENVAAAVEYCLRHPYWRLSVQVHKLVGLR